MNVETSVCKAWWPCLPTHTTQKIPDNISTIEQLLFYLTTLGEEYNNALNDINKIHVACDQEYVDSGFNFKDCQEIAIFPPVTGG